MSEENHDDIAKDMERIKEMQDFLYDAFLEEKTRILEDYYGRNEGRNIINKVRKNIETFNELTRTKHGLDNTPVT